MASETPLQQLKGLLHETDREDLLPLVDLAPRAIELLRENLKGHLECTRSDCNVWACRTHRLLVEWDTSTKGDSSDE